MFLIRWFRSVVSLPLRVLGWPLYYVYRPMGRELLMAVWPVTRSPASGVFALLQIVSTQGRVAAIQRGLDWAQRWPSSGLWSVVGLLAIDENQLDLARQCLQQAQLFPPDPEGRVDMLDYFLETRATPRGEFLPGEVLRRFTQRRDLSPTLGRLIEMNCLWQAVLQRDLSQARQRAEKILQIENMPSAHMAMGLVHAVNGESGASTRHFNQAIFPGDNGPQQRLYYEVIVQTILGHVEAVRDGFTQLQAALPSDARALQPFIQREMPQLWQRCSAPTEVTAPEILGEVEGSQA